jgi:hypothetical protein
MGVHTCMEFMIIAMGLGCLKQKSYICDAFSHLAVLLIRKPMPFHEYQFLFSCIVLIVP